MTTPSPASASIACSSMSMRSRAVPNPGTRATTTSLKAVMRRGDAACTVTARAIRSWTCASSRAIRPSAAARSPLALSARNPTLPKLTPSTAAWFVIASWSASRMVPSPAQRDDEPAARGQATGLGARAEADDLDADVPGPRLYLEELGLAFARRIREHADERVALRGAEPEWEHRSLDRPGLPPGFGRRPRHMARAA